MSKVTMPEPVGWISRNKVVGPGYGEERFGALPVQSLNPLAYEHVRLFSADQMEGYAAAKVRESQEWQPIETAPRDGTSIIGYSVELGQRETYMTHFGPGSIGHQLWKDGKGPLESGWMWYEPKNNWAGKWNPTHWRHCPPEPITE